MRKNKLSRYYGLGIVFLVFALYSNTISNEYAIDDPIVTNNELTNQGIKAIPEIFTSRYRVTEEYNYGYRPMAKATFAIEHEFFGVNPHISHFINVLIYALLAVVLFLVLCKLFRNYDTFWSFCITILFIAHPVHTEVVASLKNREEMLSFLGGLSALYFVFRYLETKDWVNILMAVMFFIFGYLSKQNTVAFIAIIPLSIYFFSKDHQDVQLPSFSLRKVITRVKALFQSRSGRFDVYLLIAAVVLVVIALFVAKKKVMYLALIPMLIFSFRNNTGQPVKVLKHLASPMMLLGISGIVLAYYFNVLQLMLGSVAFLFLHRYFYDSYFRGDLKNYFGKLKSNLVQNNSLRKLWLLDSGKVLFGFSLLLGVFGFSLWYVPDLFLDPVQRELHYFENPLFYINNWWTEIATGLYSLLIYIKLLIYPHPLVFYYGFNHIPIVDFLNGWVIVSLILHLSMFVYAIANVKQRHILSFAILYYLIGIFMFSNLAVKIPGIVGERLLFMPSLGFCVAIAFIIFKILKIDPTVDLFPKESRLKLILAFSLLLIPYSIKTVARNFNWKDHLTLYTHDIPYLENSLYANSLVASEVLRNINTDPVTASEVTENQQKLKLVIKHFKQVLELDANDKHALNNLGTVYYSFFQEYETAIPYFQKALSADSSFAIASFNMAYCLDQTGNSSTAIKYYQRTIKLQPTDIKSISNLANLYHKLGDFSQAVRLNKKITEIDPSSEIPYMNMANYYLQRSDEATAVEYFEKAAALALENYELCLNLSDYFKEQGNSQKALYYSDLARKAGSRIQQ